MSEENQGNLANLTPEEARLKFGAALATARQQAGYSVEELAHATKILAQFITALEVGEFERLPGTVFVRGFVKVLAPCWGLTLVRCCILWI